MRFQGQSIWRLVGAPREQVWKETGWFQGVDGKWRFEIDDSTMGLNTPLADWINRGDGSATVAPHVGAAIQSAYRDLAPNAPMRMKRIFSHDKLDRAYPHGFTDTPEHASIMGMQLGLTDDARGALVKDVATGRQTIALHEKLVPGEAKSTALHELQHAIQDREGFALGYNTKEAAKDIADARFREMEYGQKSTRMQNAHSDEARLYLAKAERGDADAQAFVKQAQEKWQARLGEQSESNPYGIGPLEAVAYELTETDDVFRSIHSEYTKALKKARMSTNDLYKAHAGEVEARAVQSRQDLTPEQRRARAPWLDYDVPEADQIVRFK
jgi:hypothetical protein